MQKSRKKRDIQKKKSTNGKKRISNVWPEQEAALVTP